MRAFAARRCALVLSALADDALRDLSATAATLGVPNITVPADITRRGDIDRLIARSLDAYGRIDVLANVAGIGASPALAESSDAEIERVLAVNLLGAARLMHAVLPVMKAQRCGAIVNVGSIAGEAGVMGVYSASKFGLRGLCDSVRREVRSAGIRVSLIEPGFVRTGMNAAMGDGLPGPEIVAAAIVAAAIRPRRKQIVPWYYRPAVAAFGAWPWFTDLVFGNPRIQARLNRDARAARHHAAP